MIHAENEFVKQKILSREIFLINLRTFNKITAVPGKTGCRASCAAPVFFQTLNASPKLAVFHVYAAEGAIKFTWNTDISLRVVLYRGKHASVLRGYFHTRRQKNLCRTEIHADRKARILGKNRAGKIKRQ